MSDQPVDTSRRNLLAITCGVGAVGGVAAAVPFVSSFQPSERARAAGAPVEVDISALQPSHQLTVEWRGKPVWIVRRTPEQLAELPKLDPELADPNSLRHPDEFTPEFARNTWRSRKPEYLVVVGICTHLGCSPSEKFAPGTSQGMTADWPGGFLCPCHGSIFDLAGRVYLSQPAPTNLEIPPHKWLSAGALLIGEDDQGAA